MWILAIRRWISSGDTMARSATRVPIMISRSDFTRALLAVVFPWAPIMPMFSGCSVGRRLRPIIVVTTGMPVSSANRRSSASAWARNTPPPAQITGFRASPIAIATLAICLSLPRTLGL